MRKNYIIWYNAAMTEILKGQKDKVAGEDSKSPNRVVQLLLNKIRIKNNPSSKPYGSPFLTEEEQKLVDQGKIQDPEWD